MLDWIGLQFSRLSYLVVLAVGPVLVDSIHWGVLQEDLIWMGESISRPRLQEAMGVVEER